MANCALSKGFSIKEKLFAQISFFGILITGTLGIIWVDYLFVIPYVLIGWYGVPGIIQRYIVCPRCPHLHQFGDCLQLPVNLTRLLVKRQKSAQFSLGEKAVFWAIFLLIPTYPLYWLIQTPLLLALFITFTVMWYAGQFFYFCKRCRIQDCPFNRTGIRIASNLGSC